MAASQPPLLLLSSGMRVPTILPAAYAFASIIGATPRLLLRVPQRANDSTVAKYGDTLRSYLPQGAHDMLIEPIRANVFQSRLKVIADEEGGILALEPSRWQPLPPMLANNYERYLTNGPFPVLTLRPDTQVGTIRRILFPADFSPRSRYALDAAIALCQQCQAALHILHVFGPDRLLASEVNQEQRKAANSPKELFAIDRATLDELADHARQAGVSVTTATAEGRAHTQICAYATTHQIDLVVLGTHGPRSAEDVVRGTTTQQVVRKASVPVLTLQC